VKHAVAELGVSERFACRVLGQPRATQRKAPKTADDEAALTEDIIALARQFGRYGYRRIAALLRDAGWLVNKKRVERIWRQEGLKVPQRQPKRGRLWLNDGSCIRLRPERPDHVWAKQPKVPAPRSGVGRAAEGYDFVEDRTHDGRKIRMLNIVDEFTREAMAIRVARRLNSNDAIDVLSDLFILRGVPTHIRSDNGPEFIAEAVQAWITAVGAQTAYITPGSPWENGYIESFNARLRDEFLNGEIFYTLQET
jgi:transposase InsO family protein